jgi:hypothetical protein
MLRPVAQDTEKVVEQDRDVFASRIQRRQMDGEGREPPMERPGEDLLPDERG